MFEDIIKFIQETYQSKEFIPLHEPKFIGNEKKYLNECLDSTFVSSVGKFVDEFEDFGYEVKNIRRSSKKKVAKFKREQDHYDDSY